MLIICLLVVFGRIPRQCQTGPGGLPEWLADLAPKEPRVRSARFGGEWVVGDVSGHLAFRKENRHPMRSYR